VRASSERPVGDGGQGVNDPEMDSNSVSILLMKSNEVMKKSIQ